jgi:hypothetical protein
MLPRFTNPPTQVRTLGLTCLSTKSVGELKNTLEIPERPGQRRRRSSEHGQRGTDQFQAWFLASYRVPFSVQADIAASASQSRDSFT